MDLQVVVPAVRSNELMGTWEEPLETSASARARVDAARERQRGRFRDEPRLHANAQMTLEELERYCPLPPRLRSLLEAAMDRLSLSARAVHRAIRVARTIADLAASAEIEHGHLAEALQYRGVEEKRG